MGMLKEPLLLIESNRLINVICGKRSVIDDTDERRRVLAEIPHK